jgi:hypothetical protein
MTQPRLRRDCVVAMSRRLVSHILALVATAVIVVTAAACGGSSGSKAAGTTTPTESQSFANLVCSSLVTWKQDVTKAVNSVKESPSKETITLAATKGRDSTATLVNELKSLDVPNTESSKEAKTTLTTLEDQLEQGASKIKETAGKMTGLKGSVEAVSIISTTLVTMRDQVKAAGEKLRTLPKGELKDAFTTSQTCQSLTAGTASSS